MPSIVCESCNVWLHLKCVSEQDGFDEELPFKCKNCLQRNAVESFTESIIEDVLESLN